MQTLDSYFVVAGLGLISGVALHWIKLRLDPTARVMWGSVHGFAFAINPKEQTAAITRTLVVSNNGRATAEEVEIVFAFKPALYQIYPLRQIVESTLQNGAFSIRTPHLGPKERFYLEMLTVGRVPGTELPNVIGVRSKAGDAREVPIMPLRVFPNWIARAYFVLMMIGLLAIAYVGLALVALLTRN
jgi:hypothetical protein